MILGIGLDPGKMTGFGMVQWSSEGGYELLDWEEYGWDAEESGSWWDQCVEVGGNLAAIVLCRAEDWLDENEDGVVCVAMEDFVLRPGNGVKGIGGRDAVIPVAVGAAFWAASMALERDMRCERMVSSPSAKSVVPDSWLRSMWGSSVRGGKGHGRDALRHAVLGIRKVR